MENKEIKLEDVFNNKKKEGVKKLIHEVKSIPTEEILANRCNAYEFLDFDKQETTLEEIKLEEVAGSKYCKYSIIENKLAIIYRNQEKILTAIKLINNGK